MQRIHNATLFLLKKSNIGNTLITYREISPMSVALAGIGLLHCVTNLYASSLISIILLSKASKGANGKAATKIVVKPNCRTRKKVHMVRNKKTGKQIYLPSKETSSFLSQCSPISKYSSIRPWRFMGCRFQSFSHWDKDTLCSSNCPPFLILRRDHQFWSNLH